MFFNNICYSIPPLLRGFFGTDERKIREKPRKSGGLRNSGDAQKTSGYGLTDADGPSREFPPWWWTSSNKDMVYWQ